MIESGSFRDPSSRVFYHDERILRGLNSQAAEVHSSVRSSGLMDRLVSSGFFVDNWVVDDVTPPAGVPGDLVVESARIPLVSYPSEWSFAMLQAAALATLDANLICLESGYILKDASAFNVLFDGVRPVLIDIGSIEEFGETGIWTAYGQFCDHFLAPLMLEAYAGISFQPVLHAKTEGLPIGDLNRILSGRSIAKRGVLSHVRLRSILERRAAGMDTEARRDVGRAALPAAAITATINKMRTLVAGLESKAPSTWAEYESALPYEADSVDAKSDFVAAAAAASQTHRLAVDVGANAGRFTKLLAEHFESVIGIDNDAGAIDGLYGAISAAGLDSVTPLVIDITNPTPPFGWRGIERSSFADRVRPDFSTWLAVLHHLCLGIGIPLVEVVALIAEFSAEAVVEFVSAEDPMARRISASRGDDLAPYTRELFEETMAPLATTVERAEVAETRTLYHLRFEPASG